MKKNVTRKIMALLLAVTMCITPCTEFSANAQDADADISQQTDSLAEENTELEDNAQTITETEETEAAEINEKPETESTTVPDQMLKQATENEVAVQSNKEANPPKEAELSDSNLKNPRIESDSNMTAGQKVTWDCVWFGSYPQAEVIASSEDYTAIESDQLKNGDIIADSSLYSKLQSATGWDSNNEITVDGQKYRRMKKEDATYTTSRNSAFYEWSGADTYHYFKYEPIKWRVLKVTGSQAFLLSDTSLDHQKYNTSDRTVTWENSTIRSWMNGYGSSSNTQGNDYSSKSFISNAFSVSEKSAIMNANEGNETSGTNDIKDKIFLLSDSEVYGDISEAYGFIPSRTTFDEARKCGSSTYTKAMGAYTSPTDTLKGNCNWWLRSPGSDYIAKYVNSYGSIDTKGDTILKNTHSVRAALNLNLSSNLYSYAGTVSSDGKEDEIGGGNGSGGNEGGEEKPNPGNTDLNAPKIEKISSMTSGQKVTWDCVWFGSYPQSEVENTDSVYSKLQSATGWDANNDITINGKKYRRMKKEDATYATSGSSYYYDWSDADTYHYFKYEPIKWRVLNVDGNQAFLLSDVALDDQNYNTEEESITWETSTIRSWLNGYDSSVNERGHDYRSKNFIGSAFSSNEKSAIVDTTVLNANNITYETPGGNDTTDKIFLLSESEMCGDSAEAQGFVSSKATNDEARRCASSTYAKAMGVYSATSDTYNGNCSWWLRTPGNNFRRAEYVYSYGHIDDNGIFVNRAHLGVRVALKLNLSSALHSYAGTVSSDGTKEEIGNENENGSGGEEDPEPEDSTLDAPGVETDSDMSAGQKVTWKCVWFGNYPQGRVTSSDTMYSKLQSATEWDDNNDITIDGQKYRRMKKGDATHAGSEEDYYYKWADADTYHYFKYEPIKWRVLNVDGDQALLLSDIELDDQKYNTVPESITWETSTIRSWLNGYGASSNKQGNDYSRKNFIGNAFSASERSAIINTNVVNDDNINSGTTGGNDTTDKLFLLSESEVYGERASSYGFVSASTANDEARMCKSSTYAKAMGATIYTSGTYKGNCWWSLRSPGGNPDYAAYVGSDGYVQDYGYPVNGSNGGIRVALNLNLSFDLHSYAGTVSSDEMGDDTNIENGDDEDPGNKPAENPSGSGSSVVSASVKVTGISVSGISKKIAAGKKVKLTAKVTPSNATNKAVTWKSSNTKVATVNSSGVVTMKKKSGGKSATITATAKDDSKVKATYKVTSMKGIVKKVTISGKKTVKAGKVLKLKGKVTATKKANKRLKWSSSNTKYAKVCSSCGRVTTLKAGKGKKVKITAMAVDGSGKKKTVTIKIK